MRAYHATWPKQGEPTGERGEGRTADRKGKAESYGGDTAKRGAAKTLLGAGLGGATVNDCDPTKALSVVRANRFGDPGVTTFKANAANNAIDGE